MTAWCSFWRGCRCIWASRSNWVFTVTRFIIKQNHYIVPLRWPSISWCGEIETDNCWQELLWSHRVRTTFVSTKEKRNESYLKTIIIIISDNNSSALSPLFPFGFWPLVTPLLLLKKGRKWNSESSRVLKSTEKEKIQKGVFFKN